MCSIETNIPLVHEEFLKKNVNSLKSTRHVASIPLSFGCFLGGGLSVGFTPFSLLDPSFLSLNTCCKILSQVSQSFNQLVS